MKKAFLFLFFCAFCILHSALGQGGTWTWINGTNTLNSAGVYGTQGIPSASNHPPALYEPCEWKDKQGNFWIFGGVTNVTSFSVYVDLWKYNPVTNEWTWVKGNGLINQSAIYGTKEIADPSNSPGGRGYGVASWIDTSGNFWMFGGQGFNYPLNDLWKYDISNNSWTWMSGDSLPITKGIYGVQGIPSALNVPDVKYETGSAWADSLNNLWLFGGYGQDDSSFSGDFNDLWKYNISTNEWTWMKGSSLVNYPASYGIKGVSNVSNDPGARWTYTKWKDLKGNFWIMGGYSSALSTNDIWMYNFNVNEWTWMYGSDVPLDTGNYKATCVFDTLNMPLSRAEHRSSVTDNTGKFWLFGGSYIYPRTSLSDLWVFDPQQLMWEWLDGTNVANQVGNYGTLGVPSSSNIPPSRFGALAWWGNDNKFYMFGGAQVQGLDIFTFSDLWVFNPDTNCGSIVVIPPIANFQSSKTTLCANDCINFTDLSSNATAWQWSFAGAMDSTSTAQNPQSVCYSNAGVYSVTLIASNSGGSDTVTFGNYIHVGSAPPTPDITQVGNTLYCSTDTSYKYYQWFLDSTLIAGATDTFLVVTKSGDYNVQVSNENGCKIAVGINVIIGIQNYVNDNIVSIYPNPTADELLISGNWKSETGKLTVLNVLGETIYSEMINRKQETINCKPFPSGIYFVQVTTDKERWVGRFVKE